MKSETMPLAQRNHRQSYKTMDSEICDPHVARRSAARRNMPEQSGAGLSKRRTRWNPVASLPSEASYSHVAGPQMKQKGAC